MGPNQKIFLFLIVLIIANLFFIFSYFKTNYIGKVIFNKATKNLETGFVTKVIDGDTVVVNGESVRLLGIDADEKNEPCYKEAKKRVEELVLNKEVILEKDIKDKDQYKRSLRYIFVEENGIKINVNLILVEECLAIARFYEDKNHKEEILQTEINARENKIGCKWNQIGTIIHS